MSQVCVQVSGTGKVVMLPRSGQYDDVQETGKEKAKGRESWQLSRLLILLMIRHFRKSDRSQTYNKIIVEQR
jgi:hypothetical protein